MPETLLRNSLTTCQDSPLLRSFPRPLSLHMNMAPLMEQFSIVYLLGNLTSREKAVC
jgi:hypothetical protein